MHSHALYSNYVHETLHFFYKTGPTKRRPKRSYNAAQNPTAYEAFYTMEPHGIRSGDWKTSREILFFVYRSQVAKT